MPFDSSAGAVGATYIVECPGKSKADLMQDFKQWAARYFNSLPEVLKMEDQDKGLITIKANWPVLHYSGSLPSTQWYADYTLTTYFKDGKFRAAIDQVTFFNTVHNVSMPETYYQMHPWENPEWEKGAVLKARAEAGINLESQLNTNILKLYQSLAKAMNASSKDDDW